MLAGRDIVFETLHIRTWPYVQQTPCTERTVNHLHFCNYLRKNIFLYTNICITGYIIQVMKRSFLNQTISQKPAPLYTCKHKVSYFTSG
jgi:hypothetical protein